MRARIVPAQVGSRSRIAVWLRARPRPASPAMLDARRFPSRRPRARRSASFIGGACARSIARRAGPARTASRSSCSPPACCSGSAGRSATRRCASPTPASPSSPRSLARNRARRDAHELLVERVAREMTRAGRLAWRGLAVRARVERRLGDGDARRVLDPPHDRRGLCRADRPRDQGAALRPARRPAPRDQAAGLPRARRRVLVRDQRRHRRAPTRSRRSAACWSRRRKGSWSPAPAPKRPTRIGFALWMALARATPVEGWRLDDAQAPLGDSDGGER